MKPIIIILMMMLWSNMAYWYTWDFLEKFQDTHQIIWCINTKTNKVEKPSSSWNCFIWKNYQNIMLPPKSHVLKYLEVYEDNVDDIIKSFPTENMESSFNEDAWNKYAYWYVQTLRKYKIKPDIESQLTWKKERQENQLENKKQCWFYKDDSPDQIKCIYRYHYHATKWYAYAEKSYILYLFYKKYLWY